jgi:hypothetical protein
MYCPFINLSNATVAFNKVDEVKVFSQQRFVHFDIFFFRRIIFIKCRRLNIILKFFWIDLLKAIVLKRWKDLDLIEMEDGDPKKENSGITMVGQRTEKTTLPSC